MLAREIMSHPVVSVQPWTSIAQAAELLAGRGFTALPVVDDHDRLVGIVSHADLIHSPLPPDPGRPPHWIAYPHNTRSDRVQEVMTTVVHSLAPGAHVADIAKMMLDGRISSLPIVDRWRVVGIITGRDLLRTLLVRADAEGRERFSRQAQAVDDPNRWTGTVGAVTTDIRDFRDDDDGAYDLHADRRFARPHRAK